MANSLEEIQKRYDRVFAQYDAAAKRLVRLQDQAETARRRLIELDGLIEEIKRHLAIEATAAGESPEQIALKRGINAEFVKAAVAHGRKKSNV